uniref:Uncharacterized protein n=1 Tax=Rhizophora mucronata TaxID=61149 RepID=A0A2P2PUR7_RHIMU
MRTNIRFQKIIQNQEGESKLQHLLKNGLL